MSNNRRQTLGGLSPAVLNTRQSLGPARIAKDLRTGGKGAGLGGRPANNTMAGPATIVPRRSSTYAKSGGPKNDPRPVKDKGYQAGCIQALIVYLSAHGYDQPLTPKLLANPMGKDVNNIMYFLMRQVDPHLKELGKMEDEVPAFFKRLRYPFGISKSALFAVGSPHTWPGLLAALVWLTELLVYEERAEQAREEAFDDRVHAEMEFFRYVATAYRHFLAGNDAACAAVDEEQSAAFRERADAMRARNQELAQENERLAAQIAAMRDEPSPLEAARGKRDEHLADRAKFQKLIESLQGHKEGLQRKVTERQADARSKQAKLDQAHADNEAMRARIASQTVSRDDVIRMNHERVKQEERLRSVAAQREGLDGRVHSQELAAEQRLDALDAALQAYHSCADRLQLIPASAKRAKGVQFEAMLDRSGATASELINVDLKGTIKAALVRVRDEYAAAARQLGEDVLAAQEDLDAARHTLGERAEENAALASQVAQLERQLAGTKEGMEEEMRRLAAEADGLKGQVAALRGAAAPTVAESEASLAALQVHVEEVARGNEAEAEALEGDLGEALQALLDHKLHCQAALERVHAHLRSVHEDVGAMPLPALPVAPAC